MLLARVYGKRKRNYVAAHLSARGYFVSTLGRDEETIRQYLRNQESDHQKPAPPAHAGLGWGFYSVAGLPDGCQASHVPSGLCFAC